MINILSMDKSLLKPILPRRKQNTIEFFSDMMSNFIKGWFFMAFKIIH